MMEKVGDSSKQGVDGTGWVGAEQRRVSSPSRKSSSPIPDPVQSSSANELFPLPYELEAAPSSQTARPATRKRTRARYFLRLRANSRATS